MRASTVGPRSIHSRVASAIGERAAKLADCLELSVLLMLCHLYAEAYVEKAGADGIALVASSPLAARRRRTAGEARDLKNLRAATLPLRTK